MTAKWADIMAQRPPLDEARVERLKGEMLSEVRAYRLREMREAAALTQAETAERLDVSQRRVSAIEHGLVGKAQVDTLRRYVEAIGGELRVEAVFGDTSLRVA